MDKHEEEKRIICERKCEGNGHLEDLGIDENL
jgi:hypothetical protein